MGKMESCGLTPVSNSFLNLHITVIYNLFHPEISIMIFTPVFKINELIHGEPWVYTTYLQPIYIN